MKSLSETLYLRSPGLAQNVALSLYGWRLNRVRYGHAYKHHLAEVNRRANGSPDEISAYADDQVRKIVSFAVQTVPYYRALFRKEGLSAREIGGTRDLCNIPLLEKDPIRQDPKLLVSDRYDIRKLRKIHTTGTTGTPLVIYCDESVRQTNYAFYDNFLSQNGIRTSGKRATFGGRIIVPPERSSPPFWRYSIFQKNLLFSSYHLSDRNIPYYIKKLKDYRPDWIDSYPSSLIQIAIYALQRKLDLIGTVGGITTSAETLFEMQRETIERAFGIPVIDQYGAAEMCIFVGQCREGSYHLRTDYAAVEFLREDGSEALPGEEAEIVCTGFINPVMPLIRYRIGDRGILSEKTCSCGSPFPSMEKVIGRQDDVILTPDGRRVGRLSPVLKGFPVKEVQYIQNDVSEVEVCIVKGIGYSEKTDKEIISELQKRLGCQIAIHLRFVETICRGSGGKYKSVFSKLRK